MKNLLIVLALGVFSSSANAAMILVGAYENQNDDALDTSFISGEAGVDPDLIQIDRVDWDDTTYGPDVSGALTITGTTFKEGEFFADGSTKYEITAFDWSISEAADYITFKLDSWLLLYQLTEGTMGGSLDIALLTADVDSLAYGCCVNDKGIVQALSHSATYSAVPVPAAVWLFATGLLGLIGVARRKA